MAEINPVALEAQYETVKRVLSLLQENATLGSDIEKKRHIQQITAEFHNELRELARHLNKEEEMAAMPGNLYGVKHPPQYVQVHKSLFKTLKNALTEKLPHHQRPAVMLEGETGSGKSVIAALLAHDDAIRLAFPDGVYWLNLGSEPDILSLQNELLKNLGDNKIIVNPEVGTEQIQKICDERACLFILDDVWDIQDIMAFKPTSKRNQLMITSAHPDLFEFVKYSIPDSQGYKLEALAESDAQELFLNCAGQPKLDDLDTLVMIGNLNKQVAYNPLAIRLLAGSVREQTVSVWSDIGDFYAAAELDFNEDYPEYLQRALQVALDALGEDADYYLSLAVFNRYYDIPQAAVISFWQYLYKLPEKQAYNLLLEFAERGLFSLSGDAQVGSIHLLDFQYAYLHADPDLDKLHVHLLTAYNRQCLSGWLSGPDDGYFYQNLCLHLHEAKRMTELKSLLLDFEWMLKKLEAAGTESLVNDYSYLEDETAKKIQQALMPDDHMVAIRDAEHLADTLFDSLWEDEKNSKDVAALLNQAREILPDWEPPYPDQDQKML
jgi:hypothetical protein